ncbi:MULTISPECIES: TIGR03085 family metal-binding protein [Saccharothrix]|uniref:TIGR03085 family metal-binding protein n=1 Tax=Saccharothrix TaxID=2071 RepID=UPI00093B2935|nr:TIGR03085 family metal-binding protein [Saccharothrix sp. CB00851]OKI14776.1 TIGR03085 family protein [Saccharothrix sp. CB00851]
MGVARDERRLLTELFAEVGPDAPTLCDPWRTRDLAAHLVLRERRPDAAAGILVKPLAGHTQRVQDAYAAKPWDELVGLVRVGPPRFSPYALADELVNAVEYFVHHEDVRRAREDWEPRSPDPVRDAVLWRRLAPTARLMYRKSPVGVVLRRPDGEAVVARRGANPVVLTGQVSELLVHVFGRAAARVEYDGEAEAVRLVRGLDRSM